MKRFILTSVLCSLAMQAWAGAVVTPRTSTFEKALKVILAGASPQMSSAVRENTVKEYEDANANKGLAIELVSGISWRSSGNEDQSVTGDRTLEGCQLKTGKPCALIAVNEDLVVDGQLTARDMPKLHYAGGFDLTKLPILNSSTQLAPALQRYLEDREPKSVVIHTSGKIFVSQGRKDLRAAIETTLAECNGNSSRVTHDGNCFVYAINNDVVISRRLQIVPDDLDGRTVERAAKVGKVDLIPQITADHDSDNREEQQKLRTADLDQVSDRDLPKLLQTELKRVGCSAEDADGNWKGASQRSLAMFNKFAGTNLETRFPTVAVLGAVSARTSRVCPLICDHGFKAEAETCVKIDCESGFVVNNDNVCEKKRATTSTSRQDMQPEKKTLHQHATVKHSRGSSCFYSRGMQFCP